MEEKAKKDTLPYTCTPAYDRSHCGNCVCATCYEQEFCDHCSSCKDLSHKKESCNSYEAPIVINDKKMLACIACQHLFCSFKLPFVLSEMSS